MSGNFIRLRPYIYILGNLIDPAQNNTNEGTLYQGHNDAFNEITGHQHTGAPGDAPQLSGASFDLSGPWHFTGLVTMDNAPQLTPIGSIIPFQDFGGLVTFNTTYWKYSDGTSIPGVATPLNPLGGQSTIDMSGRYLVGFGTDGGGNIGTAPWLTAAVGNVNHEINIQHSHTVSAHHHTGAAHTHTIPSHDHGTGNHTLDISEIPSHTHPFTYYQNAGSDAGATGDFAGLGNPFTTLTAATGGGGAHNHGNTTSVALTTNSGGGADTGDASPGTDNQLSTTQSIQPHSIRVRYLVRIR